MFEMLLERRYEERRQTVGVIASHIINSSMLRGRGDEPVTPYDIFPDHKKEPIQQTPEDQVRMLKAMFAKRLIDKRANPQ